MWARSWLGMKPRDGTRLRFLFELARFGARKLMTDRAPEMAAALAYRTIFSLIPVLVLSLVIFQALAGPEGIRYGLQKTMEWTGLSEIKVVSEEDESPEAEAAATEPAPALPGRAAPAREFVGPPTPLMAAEDRAATEELSSRIEEFINRTVERLLKINFGIIAVIGIVFLIYGALSLVIQIEQAFNVICRAATGRKLMKRLVNYWAVLTLGPIGLLMGFLVGDAYQGLLTGLPEWAWWATAPANYALKVGLSWLILILAYRLMPNTRIRLNAAAVGALIAAILWEFAKFLLASFVRRLTDPDTGGSMAVYGSLALVPLFLMWVYITWLVILFGLEVTFALQTVSAGRHIALQRLEELPIVEPGIGVLVVRTVASRFAAGKPSTAAEVALRCGLADITAERVLEHLAAKGILHRVQVDDDPDIDGYSLAKPSSEIDPGAILAAMHELAGEAPANGRIESDSSVLRMIRDSQVEAVRSMREALFKV